MLRSILKKFQNSLDAPLVEAHCDGPCGIYDPASARISGEAVRSMTKKILALTPPDPKDATAMAKYNNTLTRYVKIKEEQAHETKEHLLVLWTDFFKPQHLDTFGDLHDTFWKAAKLCSACKVEVSAQHADELMDAIEKIHNMFWQAKGRKVEWVLSGG